MQTAQVIPFRFETREVRTLLIDDQPWFCAADVCAVLEYANSRQAIQKNCREKGVSVRDTPTKGGVQAMIFIDEGNLYRLIIKSRKEEAQRFEAWVCDEVLPAIRKHGRYEDTDNHMATLVGQTIGTDGFHMLGALIKGKVSSLPVPVQRRATAKIWSQTHAAFGVRSAADIPAEQLDAARNFIAAYSVYEGDWLPKEEKVSAVDTCSWSNIAFLVDCVEKCWKIVESQRLATHLSGLGCNAGIELASFLWDGLGSAAHVKKHCAAELALVG
ncbi:Bro-N domain-containing protein [Pseudomonas citronellolis]|uniref:BRO-N domain-containing protein n=1 Tax=Pseudomonas citronellolis TaxID=53408 RepID=UPI00248F3DD6|nr:Bro-N domain-containing protein [Pseudomonas citronellolis]